MARVCLETSFFSACVSTRTTPRSLGWRATSLDWWKNQRHRHELFISEEVTRELSSPEFMGSQAALMMVRELEVLAPTPDVRAIAELLVSEKLMPGPSLSGDAAHVALAIAHRMDYLLTWNVQHLANPNKRTHLAVICMRLGIAPPVLVTADMLQETDDA